MKVGDDITKGRIWVKEHKVKEPKEQYEFEFENKILNLFEKTKNNLPVYIGYPGPNSNGFIQYLIESNGGEMDKVPGGYGQENTKPYKNEPEIKENNNE